MSDRGRGGSAPVCATPPDDPALHERVRRAYWAALDEAADPTDADRRLRALLGELEASFPSAIA